MTAHQRVARTQFLLAAGVIAAALGWGIAVTLGTLAVLGFVRFFASIPVVNHFSSAFAISLGVLSALLLLWRARGVASASRVALWIEERLPRLQYALVTAIDTRLSEQSTGRTPAPQTEHSRVLEYAVAQQDISGVTNMAFRRALLPAAGAVLVAALLLYVSPASAFGRSALFGRNGTGAAAGHLPAGSRLDGLRIEVISPAYSGRARVSMDDPASVRALVGSRIIVNGSGPSDGLLSRLGDMPTRVGGSSSRWETQLTMPSKPAALTLTDRSFELVLVLEPQIDEPPKVALLSPIHDTTLRRPQLVVRLHAQATDDVGLADARFEYLITSGSGEVFTGRTITTPVVNFAGSRAGALDATLDLSALKLAQGDVVSIRALARDANTLTGPSSATSETRTFRIARADEYDSISVEAAAPPPVDSSAISQRMLVMMTEALLKKEKTLSRPDWVKQVTDIGSSEDRIRRRVHDILYQTESSGAPSDSEEVETASPAVLNSDLKQAYDALSDATRSLGIAAAREALPPMRVALQALDRVRLSQRLYLRGTPPKIIVDLQRVRLTGKEKGTGSVRTPRSFADSVRLRMSSRFNTTLDLIRSEPARAMRELALLRVEALTAVPEFAAALGQAADAMQSGRDATLPLMRARRALDGAPQATPGLPAWSGG